MLNKFTKFNDQHQLFSKSDHILVAVSGGADSVALVQCLIKIGQPIAIAHCNFGLRGKESDEDAAFTSTLVQKNNVPYFEQKFDTQKYAEEHHCSIQEAARTLRYNWFEALRTKHNYQFIATAHHANDNLETMLYNFTKQCSIGGLKGIEPKNGKIIRPLLGLTKTEIISFLKSEQMTWREDSSNQLNKYHRNLIRNEVLPLLENINPALAETTIESQQQLRFANEVYQNSIEAIRKKMLKQVGLDFHIAIQPLLQSKHTEQLLFELLKPFEFNTKQTKAAVQLLSAERGKYVDGGKYHIVNDGKRLVVFNADASQADRVLITADKKTYQFETGKLSYKIVSIKDYHAKESSNYIALDAKVLGTEIILRKKREGDYFYPLGLNKKKKLKNFCNDLKLNMPERARLWILQSGEKIAAVIGKRIDHRFRVTKKTQYVWQAFYDENKTAT